MNISARLISIDYAKVIVIYLVVLGHFTYSFGISFENVPLWNIMHIITLFHMPFFFIVSGMLFKNDDIITIIKKGWKQLIIPYLLIAVICLFLVLLTSQEFSLKDVLKYIAGIVAGYDMPKSLSLPCGAMWFCYALFIIKVLKKFTMSRGGGKQGYFIIRYFRFVYR